MIKRETKKILEAEKRRLDAEKRMKRINESDEKPVTKTSKKDRKRQQDAVASRLLTAGSRHAAMLEDDAISAMFITQMPALL